MSIQQIEEKIKSHWCNLPATITVKEIKRRNQLPKWQDCPKDHLYVGIIRRINGDKVVVVKHQMDAVIELSIDAEALRDKEWRFIGVVPEADMVCSRCGDFSTRMNTGKVCTDCLNNNKSITN